MKILNWKSILFCCCFFTNCSIFDILDRLYYFIRLSWLQFYFLWDDPFFVSSFVLFLFSHWLSLLFHAFKHSDITDNNHPCKLTLATTGIGNNLAHPSGYSHGLSQCQTISALYCLRVILTSDTQHPFTLYLAVKKKCLFVYLFACLFL